MLVVLKYKKDNHHQKNLKILNNLNQYLIMDRQEILFNQEMETKLEEIPTKT